MITKREPTKTELALAEMERSGCTVAQAARKYEVTESALHRARRNARALHAGICPTCGGPVHEDGSAKVAVAKKKPPSRAA